MFKKLGCLCLLLGFVFSVGVRASEAGQIISQVVDENNNVVKEEVNDFQYNKQLIFEYSYDNNMLVKFVKKDVNLILVEYHYKSNASYDKRFNNDLIDYYYEYHYENNYLDRIDKYTYQNDIAYLDKQYLYNNYLVNDYSEIISKANNIYEYVYDSNMFVLMLRKINSSNNCYEENYYLKGIQDKDIKENSDSNLSNKVIFSYNDNNTLNNAKKIDIKTNRVSDIYYFKSNTYYQDYQNNISYYQTINYNNDNSIARVNELVNNRVVREYYYKSNTKFNDISKNTLNHCFEFTYNSNGSIAKAYRLINDRIDVEYYYYNNTFHNQNHGSRISYTYNFFFNSNGSIARAYRIAKQKVETEYYYYNNTYYNQNHGSRISYSFNFYYNKNGSINKANRYDYLSKFITHEYFYLNNTYHGKNHGGRITKVNYYAINKGKRIYTGYRLSNGNYSVKLNNVPYYNQITAGFSSGCEMFSLKMALAYKGKYVDNNTLYNRLPKSNSRPYKKNGKWYWANPDVMFLGNPKGIMKNNADWGINPKGILGLAKYYLNNSEAKDNFSINQIKEELYKGNPVIIWGTFNFNKAAGWFSFYDSNNKLHKTYANFHVYVAIGMDNKYVYVSDPAIGQKKVAINQFNNAYAGYGKKVLIVK